MCPYLGHGVFRIGTFPLCAGLGLLFIASYIFLTLKRRNVGEEFENKIMAAIPFTVLFGVATGYASDVLFRGGIKAFARPLGYGVTFFGWLIGCVVFLCVYARMAGLNREFLLNCFLPPCAIAQAVGRIGCFCGGCCFGRPTRILGIVYPRGSLPYSVYGATPLVPVQLLECVYLTILFTVLLRSVDFNRRGAVYLMVMTAGRYGFEFLRGDNRGKLMQTVFSPAQCLGTILFLLGLVMYLHSKRSATRPHVCPPTAV